MITRFKNFGNCLKKTGGLINRYWWKACVLCGLFIFIALLLPIVFTLSWNAETRTEWIEVTSKIVIPVLAFFISLIILFRTWKQLDNQTELIQNQKEQLEKQAVNTSKQMAAEQFKNAIEHLGSDKPAIVLGGIHALHDLAMIDTSYRKKILDILCSFIREETTRPKYKELIQRKNRLKYCRNDPNYKTEDQENDAQIIEDILNHKNGRTVSVMVIQTIINLLFRQQEDRKIYFFQDDVKNYNEDYFRADLSTALLWDLEMWDADFRYVDFWDADLSAANCLKSDFHGARFRYAKLGCVYTNFS